MAHRQAHWQVQPRLCALRDCFEAGRHGLPCAQQAAVTAMSALYEQQWQVVQAAAATGRRCMPRLGLLWKLFGQLLPQIRARTAALGLGP
jgi:hypothetical protein